MTYGVTVNGFNRKPLSVLLAEIEQANIDIFGPGLIQTEQSPMGQLNGLRADLLATEWENLLDVYQSLDPDQAEGARLDMLARIRLISRFLGESDESLRQAITNAGTPNTRDADFYRAVLNVDGVTWAKIYSNDTGAVDGDGLPAHSVAVVALGGDDGEIATVARQFIVPGITAYGNTQVSTTIEGFCRSIGITRPTPVPIFLDIEVDKTNSAQGCPPPSNSAIAQALFNSMTGRDTRPANGQDITKHLLTVIVSCMFPSVEIISVEGGRVGDAAVPLPLSIGFNEIATISLNDITITAV
jgi:uncharacterized phage protein gp47/JayE